MNTQQSQTLLDILEQRSSTNLSKYEHFCLVNAAFDIAIAQNDHETGSVITDIKEQDWYIKIKDNLAAEEANYINTKNIF